MNRFFYYFSWTIVLGFIIYFGAKYQVKLREEASATFKIMPVVFYSAIFPIVIGMLLRMPKLINEIKQNKQWTFDWIKFVAIGLPSLLITLLFVLIFYFPDNILPFIPQLIFFGDSTILIIAGVVFGYILLDCLKE